MQCGTRLARSKRQSQHAWRVERTFPKVIGAALTLFAYPL